MLINIVITDDNENAIFSKREKDLGVVLYP